MSLMGHAVDTPVRIDEYGYGIGRVDGILVMRYHPRGRLNFGGTHQDHLHQLYVAPHSMMSTRHRSRFDFVGTGSAFWAHRTVDHQVQTVGPEPVYRLCLREVPDELGDLLVGRVTFGAESVRLLELLAGDTLDDETGLAARAEMLAGISPVTDAVSEHSWRGTGAALAVATELAHDPGDPRTIEDWAGALHLSSKTLQRDFQREFGMSFTQWRTRARLDAARVLLHHDSVTTVARRVGYASPSAFVAAFRAAHGHTPGSLRRAAG